MNLTQVETYWREIVEPELRLRFPGITFLHLDAQPDRSKYSVVAQRHISFTITLPVDSLESRVFANLTLELQSFQTFVEEIEEVIRRHNGILQGVFKVDDPYKRI